MSYRPPFTITSKILSLSQKVAYTLGFLEGEKLDVAPLKLRKENNIKTIQASLAIEGNTLSFEQITDILEGKRVVGPKKDIVEVQNAARIYAEFDTLNPVSVKDFLYAHKILTNNLIEESGSWRVKGVGIFEGSKVKHVAPQAKRVPILMENLFSFLKKDKEVSWLLKACIFHYELEFIHPFADGNGRMGRLWQQLILAKENPIFKYISVEELIKIHQVEYYDVLTKCDKAGESTKFIEFSLGLIIKTLEGYRNKTSSAINDPISRLMYAKIKLSQSWFSRKDYMNVFKEISSSTASRDLLVGVKEGLLQKKGSKNQICYYYL